MNRRSLLAMIGLAPVVATAKSVPPVADAWTLTIGNTSIKFASGAVKVVRVNPIRDRMADRLSGEAMRAAYERASASAARERIGQLVQDFAKLRTTLENSSDRTDA